jgi:hypothetical protein
MSNALAISGVTAVLQFYLGNVYTSLTPLFGGTVNVTSLAPDLVQTHLGPGASPENQVNLFLHQVSHNAGWRNVELPSLDADGKTRLKNPPLALDLHYLLTVYGSADWQAEALLGYGVMMLHENPVLTRDAIKYALENVSAPSLPKFLSALLASGLAEQIEMIKITPSPLGREEMAWLWTALKADYRPTFPFQVSVVLIQPQLATALAWPVLRRSLQVQVQAQAQILGVAPPNGQPAAVAGEIVTVTGTDLNGFNRVSLSNPRLGIETTVPATLAGSSSLSFVVPSDAVHFPAGVYTLTAQAVNAANTVVQASNSLSLAVAAVLQDQTAVVVNSANGSLVTVTFTPYAWDGQSVSLALSSASSLGSIMAPAQPFLTTNPPGSATGALGFQFPPGLPSGAQLARLRVDGVTSQVQVNWTVHPPVFTGPMVTI